MAESSDVQALVANLRGKGLGDAEVISGLENLGYSKAEARAAVGGGAAKKTAAKKKTAPRPDLARTESWRAPRKAGGSKATSTPPGASGGSPSKFGGMPKMQPPDFSQVTLTPPKRLNGGDLAGFMAGLVLYAIGLNFIRFGVEGPKGWLSAKFLNRPLDGADTSSSKSRRGDSSGISAT